MEYPDTATVCATDAHPLAVVEPPAAARVTQHTQSNATVVLPEKLLFPRRIGRVSFIVRYVLFMFALWLGALLLVIGLRLSPGIWSLTIRALSCCFLLFLLIYFIRHIIVARLNDVGLHNLFGLLIFVPIVNLVFLLVLACTARDGFKKPPVPVA